MKLKELRARLRAPPTPRMTAECRPEIHKTPTETPRKASPPWGISKGKPARMHVALIGSDGEELSYPGYERVPVKLAVEGESVTVVNEDTVEFPATPTTTVAEHFAITPHKLGIPLKPLFTAPFEPPLLISAGADVRFPPGSIRVRGWS